jgi:hypothetical protein
MLVVKVETVKQKRKFMITPPPSKTPPRYTLAPLIKDGRYCLICRDIKSMESATLEYVEFYYAGTPWQRITRQADDIFVLVERDIIKWPALERIAAARFRIRLKGDSRSRRFIIRPSHTPGGGQGGASQVVEEWLRKRKFMEN